MRSGTDRGHLPGWLALGVGGLTLAVLMAACSSPKPSAAPASSATSSSTTSSSTTESSSASSLCPAVSMIGSVVGSEGAAGTFELTFALRNNSRAQCTLQGFPGAQLFDQNGTALATNVVRGGTYSFTDFTPRLVTLGAGASAYFNLAYSDVPTGSGQCPTAGSLWVTPPNDVDHVTVTEQLQVCDGGKLTVSPVFGSGAPETRTTAPARG